MSSPVLLLLCSVCALQGSGSGRAAASTPMPVVIDCDPGGEDAFAMSTLLGHPGVDVIAITCVRGNTLPDQAALNALKILLLTGRSEIPVMAAHDLGLVSSPEIDNLYGTDGFNDVNWPFEHPSLDQIQGEHPAVYLARIVQERPGEVTILCLGPLTNLALALHINPGLLQQAREVIVKGGNILGVGTGVEFNFFMDPYAASVVLDMAALFNTTITMVPLDTPLTNPLTYEWRWNVLGKVNNSVVSFLNDLDKEQQRVNNLKEYIPSDAYAAGVLFPSFVTRYQNLSGYVSYCKQSSGVLMVDLLNITSCSLNIHVVKEVNLTAFKDAIVTCLSSFS